MALSSIHDGAGNEYWGLNTAIEYIADFIHPELHKSIGRIKDIAAGAVFIIHCCGCGGHHHLLSKDFLASFFEKHYVLH
ncbi:MAG: diacylglycerol kinase [Gelidibacter sp.]